MWAPPFFHTYRSNDMKRISHSIRLSVRRGYSAGKCFYEGSRASFSSDPAIFWCFITLYRLHICLLRTASAKLRSRLLLRTWNLSRALDYCCTCNSFLFQYLWGSLMELQIILPRRAVILRDCFLKLDFCDGQDQRASDFLHYHGRECCA